MGENSELEEGEMNCSSDEAVVDLDFDLSYIDNKLQNVLGHLQNEFREGGALNLFGPMFCDYGSFLPTYKHSMDVPQSCQMSFIENHTVQRFSNNLPVKNVFQKFQSLPATSCQVVSNQDPQNYQTSGSLLAQAPGIVPITKVNARIPDQKPISSQASGNDLPQASGSLLAQAHGIVPITKVNARIPDHMPISSQASSNDLPQGSGSLLAQAPGIVPRTKVNARIPDHKLISSQPSGNDLPKASGSLLAQGPDNDLPEHKPIRVRIKMGSEILSQKVTRVCKDLGLDGSPKSPPRNSHDNSKMLPHASLENIPESPSRILREMTAIPVPEYLLMSPLPDSLLLVKDKEKQYTLLDSQPVLKSRKEPSIQTLNKFSDVLSCKETPSGRRRKPGDCNNVTTWNETSSIGEMKKQKRISTGQLARENLTKSNQQEGIIKDVVASAKSNKMKVVGIHAEKEKKTCPTKLKQNSSKNGFGDKVLSKMSFKDAAYVGQSSMDTGFDFAVASSSTILGLDNWVQCDSCETWRLMPYGLNTEQLPKKWLCSMQTWLPGMNHCGVSEEETTNAIKSFHASEAHGPGTGAKIFSDTSKADKSYQPLTSGSLPNPVEKKPSMNNLSQGLSSNILADAAKPLRSNSHVIKIKLPGEIPNATQISADLVHDKNDQKAKGRSAGTGSLIKIKKKKDGDKQEFDGSKYLKIGDGNNFARDIKAEEIHLNQDPEWTPAERKRKLRDNDFYSSDVEKDTKKRLLASKKKSEHKPQLTTGSGSLCTNAHGRINTPVRKIRLMSYKQSKIGNNSKLFADGEEKEPSMEKAITTKISVKDFKAHQRNELFQADGSQEHRKSDASCRYFSGGSGQISGVVQSSSSKVFGSHKSGRMCVEEVKASPVESVSSSPTRSSCPTHLASAGGIISRRNQNWINGEAGSRIVNDIKPPCQEANCAIFSTIHPRNRKKPKSEVCKQNSKLGDLPCTSMKPVLETRAGIQNFGAISHETMGRSYQAANHILQEAKKLSKLAKCFKSNGFDYEYKEANFKATLRFLLGASVLEVCSTENVEGRKMSHVEAYLTAAKLSEICAHQYETSQEMAAATLAYKCTEVACMRVVYGRSLDLSGEWNELQKMVQMTPQGESPSSSASDVDSFNHQGVIDKSAKTKRGLSHVAGKLLPVDRSQLNFVPLLDFTESINLAMEASAKSQNAFRAVNVTSEETKNGDCISAIKKVVDFSFHDVEAFIQVIEVAMDALKSSRIGGPKC